MSKKLILVVVVAITSAGCTSSALEGKWEYDGGVYNGRPQTASAEFKMQRTYSSKTYEAYLIEENRDPKKYAAGDYNIKGDSVYLTGTYSAQPSQLVGRTQAYQYRIENSRLTITGILPNGMQVEEYWKKVD